jgi:hypothetical protein
MNQLDMMQHIVDHARAWGIDDDHLARISFHGTAATIRLRDYAVDEFRRWAAHLCLPLISVTEPGTGLVADGQLMSGHRVHVTVRVTPTAIAAAGVHGVITLGHVDLVAQAGAVAA